jgi:Taurine catabolism dioxygenase TauD, TfdA family
MLPFRGVLKSDISRSVNNQGQKYDHIAPFLADVTKRGWAQHVAEGVGGDAVVCELNRVGSLLGARIGGRSGKLMEVLRPKTVEDAHPRSLSASYGLGAFPFHAELQLLESAPVLVRTGRRSFYSTMLTSDRTFLRYDPGCLEAIDLRGEAALLLVEQRLAGCLPEVHQWHQGDILIIDNWRVLHGRETSQKGSSRYLARILIDV